MRSANMVMLGALLGNMDLLSLEAIETAIEAHMPERQQKFLESNKQALRKGAEYKVEKAEALVSRNSLTNPGATQAGIFF